MASYLKELLAKKAAEKQATVEVENLLDSQLFSGHSNAGADSDISSFMSEKLDVTGMTPVTLAEGETDPRLKLISHSSRCTMHKCPRRYQLYRLSSTQVDLEASKQIEQNVTFAYGTAVGVGLQSALEAKTEEQVYLDVFLSWDTDLLEANPKQNKSFWLAMQATKKFLALRKGGFLADYELVYYLGKPAVELSFQIVLPEGYKYRGFVDAVLRHRTTGEVIVLEAKTTSGTANSTMYKNSGQALGYSVVLDKLFPDLSSYSVLYLVYESMSMEYVELPFKKSLLQRALWLQELLVDTQVMTLYESYDIYPMHGESCFDFFRDCEYLGICTLDTDKIAKPLTQKWLDEAAKSDASYQFNVTFEELVEAQISKGE